MNYRTKAMAISLLLHGTVISLVFALSISLARQDEPIVIDFTVMEPIAPPAPPAPVPQKKNETPVISKTLPQPTPPKQKVSPPPSPAVEPEGTVAITAKPRVPVPQPVEQTVSSLASNSMAGGTGAANTAGTSRTDGANQGDTAERLSNKYRAENFAYIKKIIEGNISYPGRAQRMGWTGRIVISFDVATSGHVQGIRIIKSTGYELLDENLIETIRKVEPFPKPPISVTLKIPFTYELR